MCKELVLMCHLLNLQCMLWTKKINFLNFPKLISINLDFNLIKFLTTFSIYVLFVAATLSPQ